MNRRKHLTILNYAVNGLGMGHITRLIAINTLIRRLCAIANKPVLSLFLTTSEADTLAHKHSFPAYKIPSMTLSDEGQIPQKLYRTLSRHWVWNTFALWQPDISVIDTFPAGNFGELPAILQDSPKNVFVHRAVREEQKFKPSFQDAIKLYDSVIRIHEPFEDSRSYTDSDFDDVYTNVPPIILEKRISIEKTEQNTNHILVLAGGGGDSNSNDFWSMMVTISENFPQRQFIFAIGALYRGATPQRSNITWVSSELELHHYTDCNFAISAGGFNSVYELLFYKVPTIFYEQTRKYDDQYQRITHLEKMGLCMTLKFATIDSLMDGILNMSEYQCTKIRHALKEHTWQNGSIAAAETIIRGYVNPQRLEEATDSIQAMSDFWENLSLQDEQLFLDALYTSALLIKKANREHSIERTVECTLKFWDYFTQQHSSSDEKRFILKEIRKKNSENNYIIDQFRSHFFQILQSN